MENKVALIIVFNHRYDKNLDVLERLYKDRFSNIYYLVPFYDGDRPNVIPVYENSHQFQGYFAQGFRHFFKEDYADYIFIGDDLILNPEINENNYKEVFSLSEHAAFIPEVMVLHDLPNNDTLRFLPVKNFGKSQKWYWWRIRQLVTEYQHQAYGVTNDKEMPSYDEAEAIFRQHGYETKSFTYRDLYGGIFPITRDTLRFVFNLGSYFKKFKPAYPVVASYSDILIVPKKSISKFCHYCGVLATNKLFVELAIPTALLLACDKIITEPKLGKRGGVYWTYTPAEAEKYEKDMKPYNSILKNLLQYFPKEKLYIHPVKLSKWQTNL